MLTWIFRFWTQGVGVFRQGCTSSAWHGLLLRRGYRLGGGGGGMVAGVVLKCRNRLLWSGTLGWESREWEGSKYRWDSYLFWLAFLSFFLLPCNLPVLIVFNGKIILKDLLLWKFEEPPYIPFVTLPLAFPRHFVNSCTCYIFHKMDRSQIRKEHYLTVQPKYKIIHIKIKLSQGCQFGIY